MSRLDEIKKRIDNYKEEYLPYFESNGQMHEWAQMFEDVQYMLSEVERLNEEVSDLTDACRFWREHAEGKRNFTNETK